MFSSLALLLISVPAMVVLRTATGTSVGSYRVATVYHNERSGYSISYDVMDKEKGAAYGSYNRSQNTTGWAVLNIAGGYSSVSNYSDEVVMKAAGILEGALTQPEIYANYRTLAEFWFSDISENILNKAKQFYSNQRSWMVQMIEKHPADVSWQYVNLIYQQFEGLYEGYCMVAPPKEQLELFWFDFLTGNGDWDDIKNIIEHTECFKRKVEYLPSGRCSVLFKVLPGYENIFASHSTWYIYSTMLRIYKHYSFKLADDHAAAETMSFSSYPGYLSSSDDFYIMDSELLMLQTTNPIDDSERYKDATSNGLLSWHRVRLANWLADNGRDWAEYFKMYNSGTYNNQYMVLDMKKVRLRKGIDDDAFWVVEQIPGLVEAGDQTPILREGYWASYNIPFYKNISILSGIPDSVNKNGPDSSHDLAPRAKMFRRDQSTVRDLSTMKDIMRYNGFMLNDPYAEGSPGLGICSRGDLMSNHPIAGGCIDTKITDMFMAKSMTSVIKNGPTHTNGLPVFSWSKSNVTAPHYGQPDVFDFDWIMQSPQIP